MAEKTELTDNLAYGVDLKNRRIYFGVNLDVADEDGATGFTVASVEYAVRAMHRMASDAPNKPIEIHMCSYGGDVYAMLRLYDEIHACPCQIKFFGGGAIMSAATWIMAGCDERYLYPNARIMVHELSDAREGKHTDLKIAAEENIFLMERLTAIYAENSRMPQDFWMDVCQRDLHLTASEAVSLGLADKVLEPKKRGNLRKMRYASLKKEINPKEMNKLIKDIYSRLNKVKIPKIEFNEIKKEAADPHLFVDESKTPDVTPAPVIPQTEEKKN